MISKAIILHLVIFFLLVKHQKIFVISQKTHYVSSFCIDKVGYYSNNGNYQNNLNFLLSNLTVEASQAGFYILETGEGLDKVYGLFYCRGDLTLKDCQECVENAALKIKDECVTNKEAIIFYEQCTLRYANRSIFSLEEEDPNDWSYSETLVSDKDWFNQKLETAMDGPISQVALNGFAIGETNISTNETLYCLVQCTPDILGNRCKKCLVAALSNLIDEGKTRMGLFMPSCEVMYSLSPFYNIGNGSIYQVSPQPSSTNSQVPSVSPTARNGSIYPVSPQPKSNSTNLQVPSNSPTARKNKSHVVVEVVVPIAGSLLLLFLLGCWFRSHQKNKDEKSRESTTQTSSKTFKYQELSKATNGFSNDNLLGEGGFGFVYKGRLVDREDKLVAIKQLKAESRQGEQEFQSEVEIISHVHHRNLVDLVGYCISGSHRLLVYEYLPNNSLEFHLHEQKSTEFVDWSTRMKIALGTAKGLAYLHEDCQPRIIHRDIKSSNVLLDSNFEPKIADFGLAKFYPEDKTHVTTRIMGSIGYLAPEFGSSGKLNEKADVYSFGVMLLELITGRRPVHLVAWARPCLDRVMDEIDLEGFVDSRLEKPYNFLDVIRAIACAAACLRDSHKHRPTMSLVVQVLQGNISPSSLREENNDLIHHGNEDLE